MESEMESEMDNANGAAAQTPYGKIAAAIINALNVINQRETPNAYRMLTEAFDALSEFEELQSPFSDCSDVRRLVIAAREALDFFDDGSFDATDAEGRTKSKALDVALEPFSTLVPYSDQPVAASLMGDGLNALDKLQDELWNAESAYGMLNDERNALFEITKRLVIAARELQDELDGIGYDTLELRELDKALDPFSTLVPHGPSSAPEAPPEPKWTAPVVYPGEVQTNYLTRVVASLEEYINGAAS